MSSSRIFTSNTMNFIFNMYNHDFYHSLLIYLTFDTTYEEFNNYTDSIYESFTESLIDELSISADVHKYAITITNSENSLYHSSLWKHVLQLQITLNLNITLDHITLLLNHMKNSLSFNHITTYMYNNTYYITLLNQIVPLNDISVIEANIISFLNNNNNLSFNINDITFVDKTNIVIPVVIHHINMNHLISFQNKLNNDLSTILSPSFLDTYGYLLYTDTNIVKHQVNSINGIERDIVIYFDWISLFQQVYSEQKTHYQRSEEYRNGVFKDAYNNYQSTNTGNSSGKSPMIQWYEHLKNILYETVYNQNPVLEQFTRIEEQNVISSLEYMEYMDIYDNKFMKHVSHSYRYTTKRLGNLINNHNIEEILRQLYLHGYFLEQENEGNTNYIFNPDKSLVNLQSYPLYKQLQDDDQIVFPVTINQIYGYSDDISTYSNTSIYNPNVALYTIHIKCIQKSN